MDLQIPQKTLKSVLSDITKISPSKPTLPILGNVLISTEDGRVKLVVTDLTITVTRWVDAKIKKEGSATVSASTFNDLIQAFPDQMVSLKYMVKGKTLKVTCAGTQSKIKCLPVDEFPPTDPPSEVQHGFTFESDELQAIIKRSAFATTDEDSRPALTGINIAMNGSGAQFAGADGFRLSLIQHDMETPDQPLSITVPAKAMMYIKSTIEGHETVEVTMADNNVTFAVEDARVTAQILNMDYPDFSTIQTIAETYETRAVMSVNAFRNACRAVNVIARDDNYQGKVEIKPGVGDDMGAVIVSAQSQETGESQSIVDATVEGGEMEIAFNLVMIQEFLRSVGDGQFSIESGGSGKPAVFRLVGDDSYTHIIMPMTL